MTRAVHTSLEFQRIQDLPMREWSDDDAEQVAALLTEEYRLPGGTMDLFPIQGVAIAEAADAGGLFCQAPVGSGKTIPTAMIPLVVGAERPLLLVKASLRHKTMVDFAEIRQHFRIHPNIRILTYDMLSRPQAQDILLQINPDVIIADEVQEIRNLDATRTQRFMRFLHMAKHPIRCFFFSGSMARNQIKDYWHLMGIALPESSPLPYKQSVAEEWAQALDAKIPAFRRYAPGVLMQFCDKKTMLAPLTAIEKGRQGLHRRMVMTQGVVSAKGSSCNTNLIIRERPLVMASDAQQMLDELRETWTTPDGDELIEAKDLWRKARELANGFYGVWDPPAPKPWLEARKEWFRFMRTVLGQKIDGLDSPFFVAKAYNDHPLHVRWKEIQPSFEPNTVPVWVSDFLLHDASKWLHETGGIAWVEHVPVGERLSLLSGVPYFGGGQKAARQIRETAEKHHIGPIICSMAAHGTGRNLQSYHRNLIVSCPPNGTKMEQTIGRTHRYGQKRDVETEIYLHVQELVDCLLTANAESEYVKTSWGTSQKLPEATWIDINPSLLEARASDNWRSKQ